MNFFFFLPSLIATLHCYYLGIHFALKQSFVFVLLFLKAELIFYSIILDSHPNFLIPDGSYPAFLKWLFWLDTQLFILSFPSVFPNVVFQLSLTVGMDAASLEENHPWTRCCCPFSFVFYLSPLPLLTQKVFFNLFF